MGSKATKEITRAKVTVTLDLDIELEPAGAGQESYFVYVVTMDAHRYAGLICRTAAEVLRPWSVNCAHRLGHEHPFNTTTYGTRGAAIAAVVTASTAVAAVAGGKAV